VVKLAGAVTVVPAEFVATTFQKYGVAGRRPSMSVRTATTEADEPASISGVEEPRLELVPYSKW
jgi:hypothetical protein